MHLRTKRESNPTWNPTITSHQMNHNPALAGQIWNEFSLSFIISLVLIIDQYRPI